MGWIGMEVLEEVAALQESEAEEAVDHTEDLVTSLAIRCLHRELSVRGHFPNLGHVEARKSHLIHKLREVEGEAVILLEDTEEADHTMAEGEDHKGTMEMVAAYRWVLWRQRQEQEP